MVNWVDFLPGLPIAMVDRWLMNWINSTIKIMSWLIMLADDTWWLMIAANA